MKETEQMRIHIVLAAQNASWVIGKMAYRLLDGLQRLGHVVSMSDVPEPTADINHWMSFAFAEGCTHTLNTMFVTHADDPFKVRLIRQRLSGSIELALCMSPHAAEELARSGVPQERLSYVLPAIDKPLPPRRIVVGITTRVYDDGRKREKFLLRLASDMRLDAFRFEIFGRGWDGVVSKLRSAGAQVEVDAGTEDWQGDYVRLQAAIPSFDYYLYMGMDEGSLGTLDAASAGVKTIVTAQGFHMSMPSGIDHPFISYEEMRAIFFGIDAQLKERTDAYAQWSWTNYASEHAEIWDTMLKHRGDNRLHEALKVITRRHLISNQGEGAAKYSDVSSKGFRFYLRMFEPKRIRGGIARLRWLQPLRKALKR
jgi:hypothetical protein